VQLPLLKRPRPISYVVCGTVVQEDQDKQDEERRREAIRDLVESWMDRLQLISVIVGLSITVLLDENLTFLPDHFFCINRSQYDNCNGAYIRWGFVIFNCAVFKHWDNGRSGRAF